MPKYMLQAAYTTEGARGLTKDGAAKRRTVIDEMIKKLGGRMEAFYFSFGKDDVVVLCDLPDAASAAATSLAILSSGAVRGRTTVLLTPEEMDVAIKKNVAYRAPGAA